MREEVCVGVGNDRIILSPASFLPFALPSCHGRRKKAIDKWPFQRNRVQYSTGIMIDLALGIEGVMA